jgi:predicted nucleotidyltransferase component of viral defense system
VSLSLGFLERCAAETGFRVSALEKVVRLGELAADIGRHPYLGSVLILKGGTALNLCFGPPSRLSVDLDFNFIGQAEREKMLLERPLVETALTELTRKQQYRAQKSAEAFAGRKYYLNYRSVLGPEARIEIDLNFVFRVPLAGIESRELWQPGELERPVIRMVGQEELFLGKLLALLERGAARDVWDAAYLPDKALSLLTADRFRKLFMAFSIVLERSLPTYTRERLERQITEQALTEQVVPLLNLRIDFSAPNLIRKAWEVVSRFLALSEDESAYLESADRGELNLELIFPDDPQEAMRIAGHPAIQWKMANVRAHRKRAKG